jgi:hypothetical protein
LKNLQHSPLKHRRKSMTEQTQQTPETVAQTDAVGVTMQDLALAVRIIDLAAERGAFKGVDLTAVGSCRDRLATFVTANAPPAPTEPDAAPADAEVAAVADAEVAAVAGV